MPRRRFQNLPPEKQSSILDSAFNEFSAKGYEAASLNKIIEDAGLSKGALYYYFEDKADLYMTVINQAFEELKDRQSPFPEVATVDEFWQALERKIRTLNTYSMQNPQVISLIKSLLSLLKHGQLAPLHLEFRDKFMTEMAEIARKGLSVGAIRSDVPFDLLIAAAYGMAESTDMWMLDRWADLSATQREDYARILIDMFKRLLMP